ncbi:MAG: hypothetical protein J6S84_07430 [Bacteroidales bacterium]|nr:hypothetical protein [Bacteroidales bacterium]
MNGTKIISLLPKFDTTFFERYAKIVLVDLLGEKYANLVNRDRPDLQDNEAGIGIEVTRAMVTGRDDAISLITDMAGVDDISDSDIERIRRYGYSYGIHRRLMGKVEEEFWSLAIPLKRIIESKVCKVANGFYGSFQEFGLFVFSKDELSLEYATQTMDYTIEIQQENATKYATMFIFDTHSLFVCDLVNDIITQINVNAEQCERYYMEALK